MKKCSLRNRILGSLPPEELESIASDLSVVDLPRNQLLYQPAAPNEWIYFPEQSVISFLGNTGNDGNVELWSVGSEGLAGISGILATSTPFRAAVLLEGSA